MFDLSNGHSTTDGGAVSTTNAVSSAARELFSITEDLELVE